MKIIHIFVSYAHIRRDYLITSESHMRVFACLCSRDRSKEVGRRRAWFQGTNIITCERYSVVGRGQKAKEGK